MRRITKKNLNLSKLKTACFPCLNEVLKKPRKLSIRDVKND